LPELAVDLVRRRVVVIFASGGSASALAARFATATIPIVFVTGADPVEIGLVATLNCPGDNPTGASFFTTVLVAKRVELVHETARAAASIGFLANPIIPDAEEQRKEFETAARSLAITAARFPSDPDSDKLP
jgi:putative ABC transport system substrate-binding protein